jgi:MarR family transcriptional regulator, transcriptional regulator for hemolysin
MPSIDASRNFGFLVKDVSRRYAERFERRARGIPLTLPQCKVLVRLEKNQGVSQARLAELAEIEPMTMVRILDRMEAEGWLERRADPSDRRARCLYLTTKAKPLLAHIWRLVDLARAEAFTGFTKAERVAFLDLLERIHRNMCAVDGGEDHAGDRAAEPPVRAKTKLRARARRTLQRAAP